MLLVVTICMLMFTAQAALVSCLAPPVPSSGSLWHNPSAARGLCQRISKQMMLHRMFRKQAPPLKRASDDVFMTLSGDEDELLHEEAAAAAQESPTHKLLDLFSSIYRFAPSVPPLASSTPVPSSDQDLELELEFKRISDSIWSKCHMRMGENVPPADDNGQLAGYYPSSDNGRFAGYPSEYDGRMRAAGVSEEAIPGEAHVVSRGLAYSIAGSANALCFLTLMAASLCFETPAA